MAAHLHHSARVLAVPYDHAPLLAARTRLAGAETWALLVRTRITVYAGAGAAGLTAVIALVAATTAPGRSLATAPASTQANSQGIRRPASPLRVSHSPASCRSR